MDRQLAMIDGAGGTRRAGLGQFVHGKGTRAGCCNCVAGECVLAADGACRVLAGRRCAWFERAVLPDVLARGGEAAERLKTRYAPGQVVEALGRGTGANGRTCPDCGAALRKRRRYCDGCSERRRKASYRKSARRRRSAEVPGAPAAGG